MQARDDAKAANERAKNSLESHIFNMKDTLYSELGQQLSTEEEREKINQALTAAADWLDEDGWDSTADVSYWKVLQFYFLPGNFCNNSRI